MIFRLRSGSSIPGQPGEEASLGVDVIRGIAELAQNASRTCSASFIRIRPWSTKTQVSLLPHRPVNEQRRDRGVDPAREPADHPSVADLRPDPRHLFGDHRGRRPVRLAAADLAQKAGRGSRSHRACARPRDETGCRRGRARATPWPRPGSPVERQGDETPAAALRPHRGGSSNSSARAVAPEQSRPRRPQDQFGATELSGLRLLDPAARALQPSPASRNRSLARECRDPGAGDGKRRRTRLIDRGGPAGEDQPARCPPRIGLQPGWSRQQLGEDPALTDPPRDQLGVLPAEVEDKRPPPGRQLDRRRSASARCAEPGVARMPSCTTSGAAVLPSARRASSSLTGAAPGGHSVIRDSNPR